MSPRSILKGKSSQPASQLHRPEHVQVHFPPTPQLSSTYYAHPPGYYDRSSIVVAPNDCALPKRNCPERTYVLSGGRGEARLLNQVEPTPTQYHAYQPEEEAGDVTPTATYSQRTDYFSVPVPSASSQLPDLTWSESEDSDGVMSPLTEAESYHQGFSIPTSYNRYPTLPSSSQGALSFLPHAPPPPRQRKRSISPKNRERNERKERTYSSSDSDAPSIPSSSTRRRYASTFTPATTSSYGCLDGF